MDTTKNIMLRPTLETFAAQAQVFASAWALMGGPFDSGDGLELAETERGILLDMARRMQEENEALRAQAQTCGAGAGCCAQAARIAELEAQIEAVGAGETLCMVTQQSGADVKPQHRHCSLEN